MLRLIAHALGLVVSGFIPATDPLVIRRARHYAISLLSIFLLPLVLVYYWLGLGLDEIFFRGYRRVEIKQPVFILGVPRSGTTALHEALSHDPQFTTQRTWECLFAPSISHRWCLRALARVDRRMGRPLSRSTAWINQRCLAPLTNAHPMSASAPEEDYLSLIPQLMPFILVVVFPDSPRLWRIGRGDAALTRPQRARVMHQYQAVIQRHLYAHGEHHTYLAKNASFAVWADSLAEHFPDARFIACLREPQAVVSSQLSSIEPALQALHGPINQAILIQRMRQQLYTAYQSLLSALPVKAAGRSVFLPLAAQRNGLSEAIEKIYQALGLSLYPEFSECLDRLSERARSHRSAHQHSLADYGLTTADIEQSFADINARFDCSQTQPVLPAALNRSLPKPRVLVVSDAAPERNGVGSYYADLIDHLREHCRAIRMIAPGQTHSAITHWREFALPGDSTQVIALPSPRALGKAISEFAPEVVIIATPGPYGVLASLTAKRLGARLIFGLHTDYEALAALYWQGLSGWWHRMGMRAVNSWLFHQADQVVSNSEHMHALAKAKGATSATRVQTPIPHAFIETPLAPLHTPPQRVLFVGRLAAEKRVDAVIEAARALPHLAFRIAGDGPLRNQVETAAEALPNLTYLGWQTRTGILAALDDTDVMVLPSEVEAFGTVALEAMARGRLTLVSAGCGIADWAVFAGALSVMPRQATVSDAIDTLCAESAEHLHERSQLGYKNAQAMANNCIAEWHKLLIPNAFRA